jgi:hypothetical protein
MMLSGCATPAGGLPGRSDAMRSGDTVGLGITGAVTPAALTAIVAAPYALPDRPDCATLVRLITELDGLLGPDVDVITVAGKGYDQAAGKAIASAVRGAIPYRWALRWMTGANRGDRELRDAILAGTARRGYLKGVRLGLACTSGSGRD